MKCQHEKIYKHGYYDGWVDHAKSDWLPAVFTILAFLIGYYGYMFFVCGVYV